MENELSFGAVHGESIFYYAGRLATPDAPGDILSTASPSERVDFEALLPLGGGVACSDRWRAAFDRIWITNTRTPVFWPQTKLAVFELGELRNYARPSTLDKKPRLKLPATWFPLERDPYTRAHFHGAGQSLQFDGSGAGNFVGRSTPLELAFVWYGAGLDVYYDICPLAADVCSLFITVGHIAEVWEYRYQKTDREPAPGEGQAYRGTWMLKAQFHSRIGEPMYAFAIDDHYFFVTVSGKLHEASIPPGYDDGTREHLTIELARESGDDPIVALLADSNSTGGWCFTRKSWFPIQDYKSPRPFALKPPEHDKAPQRSIDILLQCARALKAGEAGSEEKK